MGGKPRPPRAAAWADDLVVDAHVHVGAWDHADFLGRAVDLPETLTELAAAGVGGAALCPTDRCDNAGLLGAARAALAGGRWRGPLWVFPWVQPVATGSRGSADLAWLEGELGHVAGVKIHPSLSRMRISDAGFAPFLELCEAHSLVVLVHCGRWQEMASYRFAVDAAAAHPWARFVLAHAGGDTPPLATAAAELVAERRLDNVWFECSGLREHWVLERNVARLGASRFLMGSDFNLAHPATYIAQVRALRLADADKRKILGQNALEVLGRPLDAP